MIRKKGSDNAAKPCSIKFESIWTPGTEKIIHDWIAEVRPGSGPGVRPGRGVGLMGPQAHPGALRGD
jgi:hypothetical protein